MKPAPGSSGRGGYAPEKPLANDQETAMSIKICVVSTKGGVGKTTLTANLAAYLADLGQRVLMVDADPQPTLSSYFEIARLAPGGLTNLMVDADVEGVVSRTAVEGLDLVHSDDPDGKLRDWIRDAVDGRVRLKHLLARPEFEERYDVILIDTQGAVGPLQDAAVPAADFLLSPIPPDILCAREFVRGTVAMIERLKPMAYLGAPIGPLRGIIYRMERTVNARLVAEELRSESCLPSKGSIGILETAVPSLVAYKEAATLKMPAHRLDNKRRGQTPCVAETLAALVGELFPHLKAGDAPAAPRPDPAMRFPRLEAEDAA
jgi:chromosome partitioning related protein ParA